MIALRNGSHALFEEIEFAQTGCAVHLSRKLSV